ncbi:hypothetical protein NPX79_03465 [Spiroplasma endosymbiont of Anurida maritima]|uniref:hypothetical protein n=1 Tax=Spiroplasma endosymbiont of Anurida maritima TaxID=2967972 RepID=UPI0036D2C336
MDKKNVEFLIEKYFDQTISSSTIDPKKRPDVVYEWIQEKERWLKLAKNKENEELLKKLNQAKQLDKYEKN